MFSLHKICEFLINTYFLIINYYYFGINILKNNYVKKAFLQAWTAACGGDGDIKTLLIPSDKTFLLQPTVFQGPCKSSSIKVQVYRRVIHKFI